MGDHRSNTLTLARLMSAMSPDQKQSLDVLGRQIIEDVYDRTLEYLKGVIAHGMNGTCQRL